MGRLKARAVAPRLLQELIHAKDGVSATAARGAPGEREVGVVAALTV